MMKCRALGGTLLVGALVLAGCRQPQEQTGEGPIPPGAIPAAPDVRPGTPSAPGGVAPAGGAAAPGDEAMPTDTVVPGATVTGLDTARPPGS
jgi:hypothetical protein